MFETNSKAYREGYSDGSIRSVYLCILDKYMDDPVDREAYVRGYDNAVSDRLS